MPTATTDVTYQNAKRPHRPKSTVWSRFIIHSTFSSGTEFVGRESLIGSGVTSASRSAGVGRAPSHDDGWPVNGSLRSDQQGYSVEPASENSLAPTLRADSSQQNVKGHFAEQPLRSPPKLQPVQKGSPVVFSDSSTTTSAAGRTKNSGGSRDGDDDYPFGSCARRGIAVSSGGAVVKPLTECSHDVDGHGQNDALGSAAAGGAAPSTGVTSETHSGQENRSPFSTNSGRAAPAAAAPTSSSITHRSDHHGGRSASDSAVRDNWGSVFIVGGGRRRRRPPVRQKSADAEETPAARRAQVRFFFVFHFFRRVVSGASRRSAQRANDNGLW